MNSPIIDSSQLTEEQIEWLKSQYRAKRAQIESIRGKGSHNYSSLLGHLSMMEIIFGFGLFQKRENNENV